MDAGFTKDQTILWDNLPEQDKFLESMADSASSVVNYFKDKIAFINVMCNLSVDCDCCAVAEDPCMEDIEILKGMKFFMRNNKITNSIIYIGVDDKNIDLFENQYFVPTGITYNSYVILDEKIAVMDTVDNRGTEEWISNLEKVLNGKKPDYLIVSHMESDHSDNIENLANKHPEMKIVGNMQTFKMISQFFDIDLGERAVTVKEGDTLNLGKHTLQFIMAPMVHWPEVMLTYEKSEKILFSADGFGKFGTIDEKWEDEARRYYYNIVGKYGMNVQALLAKASKLDIQKICPLHGPILEDKLEYYINKYDIWSSYKSEEDGILVAYASIHGNTEKVAKKFAEILTKKGAKKVEIIDLAREDKSRALAEAFKFDKMIVASSTYNMEIFPCMEQFLRMLASKNYQNRKVGIIENGTWAPNSGKLMNEMFSKMKDITICETMITIKSALKETDLPNLEKLADQILN